jgi:hypothetical protein
MARLQFFRKFNRSNLPVRERFRLFAWAESCGDSVVPVGNNQTQTAISEDWYKCAKCGHERGFLDRRIA